MKTIPFIINRYSGTDRKKKLDPRQLRFTCTYTGDATELARKVAPAGADAVAAAGGDGSINEVARGIIGTPAMLAIMPIGSGNGLARARGIPRHPGAAIHLIDHFQSGKIDIDYANGLLFLSIAGVGSDASIASRFAESRRRRCIHYARLVAKNCLSYKPAEYELQIDRETFREKAFFITVANSNQPGYDFRIVPRAAPDHGVLDIALMKPPNLLSLGQLTVQSLSGSYLKGILIRITSGQLGWMQIDGDAMEMVKINSVRILLKHRGNSVTTPSRQDQ